MHKRDNIKGIYMHHRQTYFLMFFFFMLCAVTTEAQAVNWVNAPLACLPDRAAKWNTGTQPELCHCPPQSMCSQQSSTVKPADVTFNVYVRSKNTTNNFTISGTDVANYYSSQPANSSYAPFDPSKIFVMADNPNYGCPGGVHIDHADGNISTTQGWGAIQDYLIPLARQYLVSHGVNYNDHKHCQGSFCDTFDSFCSLNNGIQEYGVTVTVTPSVSGQINQKMQMPPSVISQCCPATTFSCPTGSLVHTGSGNSVSCQVSVDATRVGCVLAGTPVLLADGKNKKVENIKLGDHLKGEHGEVTVAAINKFMQSADEMYSFNGGMAFITSEHPILTAEGWKSINPQFTTVKSGIGNIGKLSVGDEIITSTGKLKITSIERHAIKSPAVAYNLSVKGGDGFIANSIIVKGFSQVEIHY